MARGTTLLDRLKAETKLSHDRIEQSMDLERRIGSRSEYRALLSRFYGFHAAWEPAAEPLIDDPGLFERRRKTGLLGKDLRVLGLSDQEIAALPRCPLIPMPTRAAALGAMYVVEGSTLGGAIIAHRVERRLGLTSEAGSAYFRSYGAELARMWKTFGAALIALTSPAAEEEVIASANLTFGLMEDWLCGGVA